MFSYQMNRINGCTVHRARHAGENGNGERGDEDSQRTNKYRVNQVVVVAAAVVIIVAVS